MPVICHAQPRLTYKLGAVGRFNADIFILRLVNLFMGVADSRICAGLYRAHRNGTLDMGPLGFHLLFKFQALFGLARIEIRRCFHPQLTAGRKAVFRLFQFFRCPFCLPSGLREFLIRCFRWEFVSGKFQLGRPFWFSFGCLRRFLLRFLGFCRLLEALLVFIAMLPCPVPVSCLAGFFFPFLCPGSFLKYFPIPGIRTFRTVFCKSCPSGIFPSGILLWGFFLPEILVSGIAPPWVLLPGIPVSGIASPWALLAGILLPGIPVSGIALSLAAPPGFL